MINFHKENPDFRINHSNYMKKYYKNPINKKQASKHGKKLWKDLEIRKKMLASQRKIWVTDEYRQKKREIALEISKYPKWIKNVIKATFDVWNSVH